MISIAIIRCDINEFYGWNNVVLTKISITFPRIGENSFLRMGQSVTKID